MSKPQNQRHDLQWYLDKVKSLNIDRAHGPAPHKPILLLSVMELIEQGTISENKIPYSPELLDTFRRYWVKMITDRRPNAVMPFFYLRSDGFWHLYANPSFEAALKSTDQMRATHSLREMVAFASLDEELFLLLSNKESRELIRQAIIETYFGDKRSEIEGSITEGRKIHQYEVGLFEKVKTTFHIREEQALPAIAIEIRDVRSPAFRRAIMNMYAYTCTICKLRIVTIDGMSAVDAAHIVPFSVSQNDDPRNGIGLCKLHHWAFDNGLIAVDERYRVRISTLLDAKRPTEWILTQLANEELLLPSDPSFHPSREAFAWHRSKYGF
jgi:putative restriction endonuclease